jgi:hypothetical protein
MKITKIRGNSAKSWVGPHAVQVSKNTTAQPYGERRCSKFFCSLSSPEKFCCGLQSSLHSWLNTGLGHRAQLAAQLAAQPSDRSPPRAYFRDEDLHAGVLALHISFAKDLNAVRTCFVARTGCAARSSRKPWTKRRKCRDDALHAVSDDHHAEVVRLIDIVTKIHEKCKEN